MERGAVRLGGDEGVKNEVTHIFREPIIAAIKDHAKRKGGPAADDDDDVEIVSAGKKRAASPGADGPARKKANKPLVTSFLVLKLNLTFPPLDGEEEGIAAALVSTKTPAGEPIALTDIVFQQARDNAKAPHRIYLRHAETNAALVEVDPLDPASLSAPGWISMIAPPPLTKSGKPFKRAYNAKKAPQNQPRPVVTTGAGGLLDALALFSQPHLGDEGVDVTSKLGIELVQGDSTRVLFHLYLDVSIRPALFYTSAYSRSKRILVDRLIPESDPLQVNDDAPREANIDYFYACLRRAPRTDKGSPVASGAATPAPPAETDEERVARLRREAKGKQRAVEPDEAQANDLVEDGEGNGREDEMFHPPGLTVQLMPFQARTVRWMLRREGKKIAPLAPLIAEDFDGEQEDVEMDEVDGDEDFELAATSKGKGKAKEVEKPAAKKGKGKGKKAVSPASDASEHPIPVLEDLDEATVKEMKRGPLWRKVTLRTLPDQSGEVQEKEVWLNRVSMRFTELDPVDQPGFSGTATPVVKEEAEDDGLALPEMEVDGDEEKPERTVSSKKVVGGAEGHGLLAEEVGLGKTVEALSLILLHSDPKRRKLPSYYNPISDSDVRPSGLTLIIAPTAIVGQWESEIARLTPGLRVLRYQGIMSLNKAWDAAYVVRKFDLVLTTFDVLRKEVAFARKPVQRGLRNKREIRYRRSILVEIDFLRVMMDEAQMLGDAVGPTSETASLVSRRYSWAVTSTPLRDKIADLRPLLTFLRVEPIASGTASLQRLLDEAESFRRLWNEIGERTLKSQVQHELVLPAQHRYIVPVDFNAIERFHYEERYRAALRAVGLTEDGQPYRTPGEEDVSWEPDKGELLRALTLLRQLCTHPALGQANKQALGGRVLKTVEEVYAAMKQAAVHEIQSAQRALLDARVRRGQLLMWDEEVETRFDTALELYKSAIAEIDPIIDEVTKEIHDAWAARKADANRDSPVDVRDKGVAGALELGFRSVEGADETELMSDRERAASTRIGALRNRLRDLLFVKHAALFFSGHAYFNSKREEKEKAAYAAAEQLRQLMTGPFEAAVERAQAILKGQLDARDAEGELDISDFELQFSKTKHGLMARETFEAVATTTDLLNGYAELIFQYREMIVQMLLAQVSIAGEDATGEEYEERAVLQERLTVYLEAYTVLLGEWSYGITGTRSALGDQYKAEAAWYLYDQEIIGEPKAPPPKGVEDDVIEDYGDALGEAVGAIAGPSRQRGRNAADEEEDEDEGNAEQAAAEEAEEQQEPEEEEEANAGKGKGKAPRKKKKPGPKSRFQQKRSANKKKRSYKEFLAPTIETGHSAEQVLRYQLLVERLESKGENNEFAEVTPIRQLIKALKEASERSESDREITILDRERARLQKSLPPLEKVADRLRAELSDFTTAYNARLTYFANLQQISDDVRDPDMGSKKWRGLLVEIELLRQDELELKASIESKLARRRYLENLNNPDAREDEETTCPICAESFSQGVLTDCGHLTCAACFRRWHSVSRNCAMCKQPLPAGSYQTVSYRAKPAAAQEEADAPLGKDQYIDSHGVTQSFDTIPPKLNEIDEFSREKILEIQTASPLSSKSDFVVKHVKFLRRRDPYAKVVIFSAWQEALSLLMEAFTRNGIKFVRLEGAVGKGKKEGVVATFQNDPDVAAFFLHTRSQSAGLNLTAARYVFLIEPLLHPSLELQAVARVHRITQTRDTFVFQYAITDSVDRRVADLRARQGTSLFIAEQGQDQEKESRLVQQKDRPSAEARKAAKTDELIDDEEDLARCILSPDHYLSLQRALLPARLRQNLPPIPAEPMVHAEGSGAQPAAMAGIAAAARAAVEEEEDRMDVEAGPSGP